jgi:hypothetical protein
MGLFTDDASNVEVQAVFPDANSLGSESLASDLPVQPFL